MPIISMKEAYWCASIPLLWSSLYSLKWFSTPLVAFVLPALLMLALEVPTLAADKLNDKYIKLRLIYKGKRNAAWLLVKCAGKIK